MDFAAYVESFNAGDEPRLGSLFFTDDIVFDGGNRSFLGRDAFTAYLEAVSASIRQTMTPVKVVATADHVMAELDIMFTARTDQPDFPFGSLLAGEAMTLRFFGSYYLRDGRIARIHLGNWSEPVTGKGAE